MTDETAELTDINGVGPARAKRLVEAAYETPADVAGADQEKLDDVLVPGAETADIIENARAVANGEDSGDTTDADNVDDANDVDDGETTADESSNDTERRTLELDDAQTARYLYKGLIDDELRLRQQNRVDEADEVVDLAERLHRNVGPDGGTLDVTLDELSTLYTAVRNIEQEFQQTRGITHLVGKLRDARVDIQELRSDVWPGSDE